MDERRLLLEPDPGARGELGVWLAALEGVRARTARAVEALEPDALAWRPPGRGNTVGQLLRHVALVEADWVLTDLQGTGRLPDDAPALLRLEGPMADPGQRPLAQFLQAMDWSRSLLRRTLAAYGPGEVEAQRCFEEDGHRRVFNVRWILWHLLVHEAHHLGQVHALLAAHAARREA